MGERIVQHITPNQWQHSQSSISSSQLFSLPSQVDISYRLISIFNLFHRLTSLTPLLSYTFSDSTSVFRPSTSPSFGSLRSVIDLYLGLPFFIPLLPVCGGPYNRVDGAKCSACTGRGNNPVGQSALDRVHPCDKNTRTFWFSFSFLFFRTFVARLCRGVIAGA